MRTLDAANAARLQKAPDVHLFRGAPAVRSWSKYQEIVEDWTLCGIKRGRADTPRAAGHHCTDKASLVTCQHCLQLIGPSRKGVA